MFLALDYTCGRMFRGNTNCPALLFGTIVFVMLRVLNIIMLRVCWPGLGLTIEDSSVTRRNAGVARRFYNIAGVFAAPAGLMHYEMSQVHTSVNAARLHERAFQAAIVRRS